jgi:hypothetical protein
MKAKGVRIVRFTGNIKVRYHDQGSSPNVLLRPITRFICKKL